MTSVNKEKIKPTEKNNSSTTLTIFIILTVIYIITEYYIKYIHVNSGDTSYFFYAYLAIVIVVEYLINVSITRNICGEYQILTALVSTILPWGLIFGTFIMLLSTMPGWLSPFSNTFGYIAAIMYGLDGTFKKIFKTSKTVESEQHLVDTVRHIYSDRSILINEVTPDNFEDFWTSMQATFNTGVYDNKELKKELLAIIGLKDSVAKLIWYMLIGVLVTSMSYNYLIDSSCTMSSRMRKREMDNYERNLAAIQTE